MSAPSWAVPGAKVVCVTASMETDLRGVTRNPVVGDVLTIREVTFYNGEVGLRFVEIRNPPTFTNVGIAERIYLIGRFRPIVTRSQEHDVAKFKHLLNTTHIGEDA